MSRAIALEPFRPNGEKFLRSDVLKLSKLYLVAMLMSHQIFEAGLTEIYHGRPEAYYACLTSGDPTTIQRLLRLEASGGFGQGAYRALLVGGDDGARDSVGDSLYAEDETVQGALEDGATRHIRPPLPPVSALAAPDIGPPAAFSIQVQSAQGPRCTIRFDGASHSSRIQRAYIRCPWFHHKDCWKYRQVNLEPDRNRLVAWLYGWAIMGEDLSKSQHRDEATPAGDFVDALSREMFG